MATENRQRKTRSASQRTKRVAGNSQTSSQSPEVASHGDLPPGVAELLAEIAKQQKPRNRGLLRELLPYLLMVAAVAVGYSWWTGSVNSVPTPDPSPVSVDETIIPDARAAFQKRSDAVFFAQACRTVAALLEADGKTSQPAITKREQVSEMLAGELSRAAYLTRLGHVSKDSLASLVANRFDEEKEFPQKAGPLTAEERVTASERFTAIADACEEVK